MNSVRTLLAVFALSAAALSQTHDHPAPAPSTAIPEVIDAKKAFTAFKTLEGEWEGTVTTDFPEANQAMGKNPMKVVIRATSRGNAVLHEMTQEGNPDDPITMFYLHDDRLQLTHFCDAGNRPRMTGKLAADGKRLEFNFLDVTGPIKYGHMNKAAFTFIDSDRHIEEWTFHLPNRVVLARFELKRRK